MEEGYEDNWKIINVAIFSAIISVTLFAEFKRWKQPLHLYMDAWINKRWYKNNEIILSFKKKTSLGPEKKCNR